MIKSCSRCRYADEIKGDPQLIGLSARACRRFPPQVVAVPVKGGLTLSFHFPIVGKSDWCHEFADDTLPGLLDKD